MAGCLLSWLDGVGRAIQKKRQSSVNEVTQLIFQTRLLRKTLCLAFTLTGGGSERRCRPAPCSALFNGTQTPAGCPGASPFGTTEVPGDTGQDPLSTHRTPSPPRQGHRPPRRRLGPRPASGPGGRTSGEAGSSNRSPSPNLTLPPRSTDNPGAVTCTTLAAAAILPPMVTPPRRPPSRARPRPAPLGPADRPAGPGRTETREKRLR